MAKRLPRGKPPSQRSNRLQREQPDERDINSIEYIAMHEAGHAVAAVVLGINLVSVDINRRPHPSGRVSVGFTDTKAAAAKDVLGKGEEFVMPHLIQCMTGPTAESRINPDAFSYGSHEDDRASVERLAAVAVCEATFLEDGSASISAEEQAKKKGRMLALITSAEDATGEFVDGHWEAITAVAAQLMKRRRLTGNEVAEIVFANPPKKAP